MNVLELRNNLLALNIPEKIIELNEKHAKEFIKANTDQMWDGQNPDGTDISPSYLDDPYFKTRKAAMAYANWKFKLTPNSKRNKYAPNLFINGYFYDTLVLNAKKPAIEVHDAFGSQVATSHPKALGVSMENLSDIAKRVYLPDFFKYLEDKTGLKVN